MWRTYSDGVPTTPVMRAAPWRAARAVVVAALVTPAVVLAHLLTRGEAPGVTGLCAVVALAGVAAFLVPADGPTTPTGRAGPARLTVAVVAAQVAGHAALAALTPGGTGAGCLPAVGRGADAGLHLAMLRSDTACSTGTYAAGPALTAMLGAFATAVVLVAGQVLLGAFTARLVVAAEALAAAVRDLADAALPALPGPVCAGCPPPLRGVRPADRWVPPVPVAPDRLTRRGPPAPVGA